MHRTLLTLLIAAVVASLAAGASAGQIWTDGNGDGLPDAVSFYGDLPSTNVSVDVWIDTQSYAFTYFQGWIERQPGCMTFVGGSYDISGGTNVPIDTFTHPARVGLGGTGYQDRHGVILLGRLTYHLESISSCCVVPIIDLGNPPYSILGNNPQGTYLTLKSYSGSCWENDGDATERKSWGAIKGIYR